MAPDNSMLLRHTHLLLTVAQTRIKSILHDHCLLFVANSQLGFHCIVLDPPWENKSAKRGSKYPTLPSRNLKGIPLQKLMHAVRSLLLGN